MLKFIAETPDARLYGFGLTETDLNRLEFNQEPLLFDFKHIDRPDLFGAITYLPEYLTPEDMLSRFAKPTSLTAFKQECLDKLERRGIYPFEKPAPLDKLILFPVCRSVFQTLRSRPFWAFDCNTPVTCPSDKQMFFAARDEKAITEYLESALIPPT